MNKYLYRRQFLLSPVRCNVLNDWQISQFGTSYIHVHPDTELTIVSALHNNIEIALIGFIINPHQPTESNTDILNDLAQELSLPRIFEKLYCYTGRFILLIKNKNEYYIFHDPCGLRLIFYTKYQKEFYAASQPLLLKLVMPLEEGERYRTYQESTYKKLDIENWIPSGCSLYENVHHLIPNHYLNVNQFQQIRYWPTRKLTKMDLDIAAKKAGDLLKNTMLAYKNRFKLAVPITAGIDSRTILSACKDLMNDVYCYTLKYRTLEEDSNDIRISKNLMFKLGYPHYVIDCKKPVEQEFATYYVGNSDMSHLNDWGNIANGMKDEYPENRVAVKGPCAEIAKCSYYKPSNNGENASLEELMNNLFGAEQVDFIKEETLKWYLEIKNQEINHGYNLYDLYYWEQWMGSWQAQSQLEWDIVQEAVSPFNNRELLDTMLAVDQKKRCHPDYTLFKKIMHNLWQEILEEPINPRPFYHKFKVLMYVLKRKGKLWISK